MALLGLTTTLQLYSRPLLDAQMARQKPSLALNFTGRPSIKDNCASNGTALPQTLIARSSSSNGKKGNLPRLSRPVHRLLQKQAGQSHDDPLKLPMSVELLRWRSIEQKDDARHEGPIQGVSA